MKFEGFASQRFMRCSTKGKMLENLMGALVLVMGIFFRMKEILNEEGYHSILQGHAIPCGQHWIRAKTLTQSTARKDQLQDQFREENRQLKFCL